VSTSDEIIQVLSCASYATAASVARLYVPAAGVLGDTWESRGQWAIMVEVEKPMAQARHHRCGPLIGATIVEPLENYLALHSRGVGGG